MTRKHEYRVKQTLIENYSSRLKQLEKSLDNNTNNFNNLLKTNLGESFNQNDNDFRKNYRRYPSILDAHSKMLNRKNSLENERSFLLRKLYYMNK
jgi:flagellar biosynthesis GTPase FlhF